MIHRSGFIARSLSPISRATARTRSTFALSSVSGMVKNCGAWGSIAPPITVEIIVSLLASARGRFSRIAPRGATASHPGDFVDRRREQLADRKLAVDEALL